MHMTAVGFGIGAWVLAAIMKTTGIKTLNCMPEFGEDKEALEKSKRVSSGEAFKRGKTPDADEEEEEEED